MPIQNILKLFRSTVNEDEDVKYFRISNAGHYFYCAVQAWLIAQGIDSPGNAATSEGTKWHNKATAARHPSQYEAEFEAYLKTKMKELDCGKGSTGIRGKDSHDYVLARPWIEGGRVLGEIVTHGLDDFKVFADKRVKLYEYKFTNQKYVDWYKLGCALFQMKVSMWLYEPLLKEGGYTIVGGEIDFFNMKGQPLGNKQVDYSAYEVERTLQDIFNQFRHPETLIPPARWKCMHCGEHFKSRCPFQQPGAQAQ